MSQYPTAHPNDVRVIFDQVDLVHPIKLRPRIKLGEKIANSMGLTLMKKDGASAGVKHDKFK